LSDCVGLIATDHLARMRVVAFAWAIAAAPTIVLPAPQQPAGTRTDCLWSSWCLYELPTARRCTLLRSTWIRGWPAWLLHRSARKRWRSSSGCVV